MTQHPRSGRVARVARPFVLAAGIATFGLAYPAHAQQQDKVTAEALFNDGKQRFEAKDYERACAAFRESQRLDPAISTQYFLARCLEAQGKTASAWSAFLEAAAMARAAGRQDQADAAKEKADALKPSLSRVVIEVPDAHRVEGMVVKLAGTEMGAAVWGTEIPTDPGDRTVEVSAPGHKPWTGTVAVPPSGELATARIPKLEIDPLATAPEPDPSVAPPPYPSVPPAAPAPVAMETSGWFYAGIGGLVVGVAAAGVGGVLMGVSASDNSDEEVFCVEVDEFGFETEVPCPDEGSSDALMPAGIGLLAGGVAFAGIGTALMIAFSDPEPAPSATGVIIQPLIGPTSAGLRVRF